jgi:hypothetical protein
VLFLGASNLTFSDTGPDETIPALAEKQLRVLAPDEEWRCEVRSLTYGPRMAEIAERHTRAVQAAAVVVSLVHSPFAADVPIAVIRRRWPRLYPYARSVAERLKALAGGAEVSSLPGWPYGFTRWCVARVVGQEPEVGVDDAIRYTTETLDSLLRFEDLALIPGFFMRVHGVSGKAAAVQRQRIQTFKSRVGHYCEQRHVDVFDRDLAIAGVGQAHGASNKDAAYGDRTTRQLTANLIAERVLAGLLERSN